MIAEFLPTGTGCVGRSFLPGLFLVRGFRDYQRDRQRGNDCNLVGEEKEKRAGWEISRVKARVTRETAGQVLFESNETK